MWLFRAFCRSQSALASLPARPLNFLTIKYYARGGKSTFTFLHLASDKVKVTYTRRAYNTHSFIRTIKLKKWASIGEIHSVARRLPIIELLHYRARTLFVPIMYTIPEDEFDGGIKHAMLHSDLGQIYDFSKEKKNLHVHTDFAKLLRK